MGCCLGVLLLGGAPRLALIFWWIFDPSRVESAFNWTTVVGDYTIPLWVWPVVGFIFLPWVTIAYVFVSPDGVVGAEWLIMLFALLLDIGVFGGGASARRKRAA